MSKRGNRPGPRRVAATRATVPKPLHRVHRASARAGWTWTVTGHLIAVKDPAGDLAATVSTTMYDGTLTKRVLSALRRAGCPGA